MSLRHELICKISAETETAEHMRRDRRLSSKTVFEIYKQLGIGDAGWGYDKSREDYLREILDEIGHDERKSIRAASMPVSTDGLQAILDSLKKQPEKSSQQSSSPRLNPRKTLEKLCS